MHRLALIAALCLCGLLANAAGEGVIIETPKEYDRMFGNGAYAEHRRKIEEQSRRTREHMDGWRKHAEWELRQKSARADDWHIEEVVPRGRTNVERTPALLSVQRAHFDGHGYVLFFSSGGGLAVVHSPNCQCRKEVVK